MKKGLFLILLLFLSSCSSHEQEGILPDFHKVENLVVKDSIDLEALDILKPTHVYYKDSFLIFHTSTGHQELQFLDLKDYTVSTKEFVGHGPDEVTTYSIVDHYGSSEIRIADPNLKKILSMNLDSLQADSIVMPRFFMNTPERKPVHFGFENSRYLYFAGTFEEGRFLCYDKQTEKVAYYEDYPVTDETSSLPRYSRSVIYSGCLLLGKEERLVARTRGLLNFYEIVENGRLIPKATHHYFSPRFFFSSTGRSVSWSGEDIQGLTTGCSTEQYLYFLYSDKTFEKYGMAAQHSPYLMTYDWDGNPVCEYHLEKPLWDVAVNGRTVYGLSREKEAIIYIYELP